MGRLGVCLLPGKAAEGWFILGSVLLDELEKALHGPLQHRRGEQRLACTQPFNSRTIVNIHSESDLQTTAQTPAAQRGRVLCRAIWTSTKKIRATAHCKLL